MAKVHAQDGGPDGKIEWTSPTDSVPTIYISMLMVLLGHAYVLGRRFGITGPVALTIEFDGRVFSGVVRPETVNPTTH